MVHRYLNLLDLSRVGWLTIGVPCENFNIILALIKENTRSILYYTLIL